MSPPDKLKEYFLAGDRSQAFRGLHRHGQGQGESAGGSGQKIIGLDFESKGMVRWLPSIF